MNNLPRALLLLLAASCRTEDPLPLPASSWPLAVVREYEVHARPWDVAVHDVDGDGHVDVVAGGDALTVLRGGASGELRVGAAFGELTQAVDFAFGDFDGDGELEIVVADHDAPEPHFLLLRQDRDGELVPAPGSPFVVDAVPHLHTVVAIDANGDGALDVVTDSWPEDRLVTVLGRGDGTFELPGRPFDVPSAPLLNLRSADLNGDGFADLVTPAHDSRAVTVLLGDGAGGFAQAPGSPFRSMGGFTALEVGDVDQDGDVDVCAVHRSDATTEFLVDGLSVLLNDGAGALAHAPGSPLTTGLPRRSNDLALGDLDGDGRPEVVVLGETHRALALVRVEETGLALAGTHVSGEDYRGVTAADLDGDGRAEVIVTERTKGLVRVLE